MLKVGDTVKVIGTTVTHVSPCDEVIPIVTICIVKEIQETSAGTIALIEDQATHRTSFWYSVDVLEKGQMVWVSEKSITDTPTPSSTSLMQRWEISGPFLPTIEIIADSFDAALAKARNIDARYNMGQVKG